MKPTTKHALRYLTLFVAATLGSNATVAQGVIPPGMSGYYYHNIPTNCINLGTFDPLRSGPGYWPGPNPPIVFAPANAKMNVVTTRDPDIVQFSTSHPAIVSFTQNPFSLEGGKILNVNETLITLAAPSQPTEVEVTGKSTTVSKSTIVPPKFKVRVIPPASIKTARTWPTKPSYKVSEEIAAQIMLDQQVGVRNHGVLVKFSQPTWSFPQKGIHNQTLNWNQSSSEVSKTDAEADTGDQYSLKFRAQFPDHPNLYNAQSIPVNMNITIENGAIANGCSRVKSPTSKTVNFALENPNYSQCPQGQRYVQTSTFPKCTACIANNKPPQQPSDCALNDEVFAQGYCIPNCGQQGSKMNSRKPAHHQQHQAPNPGQRHQQQPPNRGNSTPGQRF